jgi:outer membrane protein OmpA-like peptidoglycan-associated protein
MDRFICCRFGPFPVNLHRMRRFRLLLTALLLTGAPASAQVTVDLQALDALPGVRPAAKLPTVHKAPLRRPAKQEAAAKPTQPSPSQPAGEASGNNGSKVATATSTAAGPTTTPPPADLPSAPPPTAALAPLAPPSEGQPAPPPPPAISDRADSGAAVTSDGLRVTFGTGQAELSPASAAAIKGVVQSAPVGEGVSFNVVAYAAGAPDDPSTARRLSLSRALAVRSALMADGVSSARIYLRALGAAGGGEAPDRVDLAVMGGGAPVVSPANGPASDGAKSQSP